MFSCDGETISSGNKCCIRIGGRSDWGPEVPIDVVGRAGTLQIKESDSHGPSAKVYELGVMVNRGLGKFNVTKIIALMPRCVIVNNTSHVLQMMQMRVPSKPDQLQPETSQAYHWPKPSRSRRMCVRFADMHSCMWSTSFPVLEVGSLHVKLQSQSALPNIVRIEVRLVGATIQAIFSEVDDVPPFRIENQSMVAVRYHQEGLAGHGQQISTVHPGNSSPYAWDDLTKELALVLCVENAAYKYARSYDLGRIHDGVDLTYPQQFYIIGPGPEKLVLGASPIAAGAEEPGAGADTLRPVLCQRQPQDKMQLWHTNLRDQLVNGAGFVLEISKHTGALLLAPLQPDRRPSDRQKWMYDKGRLLNFSGGRSGVVRIVPSARDNGLQLIADSPNIAKGEFSKHILPPGSGRLAISIVAEGPTRVLLIKDKSSAPESGWTSISELGHEQLTSGRNVGTWQESGRPPHSPGGRDGTGPADDDGGGDDDGVVKWRAELKVDMPEGVGVSLVDNEELAYFSSRDIQLTLSGNESTQSAELSVQSVQIDDQLQFDDDYGAVVLHPRLAPSSGRGGGGEGGGGGGGGGSRAAEEEAAPAFQITVVNAFEGMRRTPVLKHLEIDLQPLAIRVKEMLLLRIMALLSELSEVSAAAASLEVRDEQAKWDLEATTSQLLSLTDHAAHTDGGGLGSLYFETLRISAVHCTVAYQKSTSELSPDLKEVRSRVGLGMLPQFDGANIQLPAVAYERPFADLGTIVELLKERHKQDVLRQAYLILGSADFLMNPIGIVNQVGLGLQEFVSKASDGHLVQGSAGFAQHVTYGVADGLSKATGRASAALGAATMDKDFQRARQEQRRASSNKDVAGHIANGFSSLGKGIVYGMTGIVTQPLKGAKTGGARGFFSGAFKGIVGAAAKPLAGMFDLASSTTAAVRTAAGASMPRMRRDRMPRSIGPDHVLRPYALDDADGRQLLLSLNRGDTTESFVAKVRLQNTSDSPTLLVTSDRIIVLGNVPSGGIGVQHEIWFSGLHRYKVFKDQSKGQPKFMLRFTVNRQMDKIVQERLELTTSSACRLTEPTWEYKNPQPSDVFTQQIVCEDERVAKGILHHIQFAFVFFSERSVAVQKPP
jgi:hypothetical protein